MRSTQMGELVFGLLFFITTTSTEMYITDPNYDHQPQPILLPESGYNIRVANGGLGSSQVDSTTTNIRSPVTRNAISASQSQRPNYVFLADSINNYNAPSRDALIVPAVPAEYQPSSDAIQYPTERNTYSETVSKVTNNQNIRVPATVAATQNYNSRPQQNTNNRVIQTNNQAPPQTSQLNRQQQQQQLQQQQQQQQLLNLQQLQQQQQISTLQQQGIDSQQQFIENQRIREKLNQYEAQRAQEQYLANNRNTVPQQLYERTASNLITDFAMTMFRKTVTPLRNQNLVLTPVLPQLILSQLYLVAEGETKDQIANTIGTTTPRIIEDGFIEIFIPMSKDELSAGSAIFLSQNFRLNATFLAKTKRTGLQVIKVNFKNPSQTQNIMNNWVQNATNRYINQLSASQAPKDTSLVIANAFFFKATWLYVFRDAEYGNFELTQGNPKQMIFMKLTQKLRSNKLSLSTGRSGTWVELPYTQDAFSMVLIQPDRRHTLTDFLLDMRTSDMETILSDLNRGSTQMVNLKIPKFTVKTSISLNNALLKMRLVDLFDLNSNIPYLVENTQVEVADIIQQSYLQVDEKGTRAASATTFSVVPLSISTPEDDLNFVLDQPFIAIICNRQKQMPILMAKIYDP